MRVEQELELQMPLPVSCSAKALHVCNKQYAYDGFDMRTLLPGLWLDSSTILEDQEDVNEFLTVSEDICECLGDGTACV
jgi:hypothetical protein